MVNRLSLSSDDSANLSSPGSVVRGFSAGKSDLLLRSLAQRCGVVRDCTNPTLCRSASLVVPPQAHEGVTLRFIGPWAFREVFYPSSGPGGYLSPTVTLNIFYFILQKCTNWPTSWLDRTE
jgi:hypothetical protein